MRKPAHWIALGCAVLLFCLIYLMLFGQPSYGRQVSRLYFLVIAGILCVVWGVVMMVNSRIASNGNQTAFLDNHRVAAPISNSSPRFSSRTASLPQCDDLDTQFVVECGVLFELSRKLRIEQVSRRIDDGDDCALRIEFDPNIRAGNLRQPMSPVLVSMASKSGGKVDPWVAMSSPERKLVTYVFGTLRREQDHLTFLLSTTNGGLEKVVEHLEHRVPGLAANTGRGLLEAILANAIELPAWDRDASERVHAASGALEWGPYCHRIRFVGHFERQGLCVLAERAVRV